VRVESPCQPTKVVALWNNFRALGEKLGKAAPAHPLYLLKPASSVIGTGAAIRRPPAYAGKIAYEGELGIVIGRRCTDASADEAEACIFGYTCINDVTATELLNENPDFPQWTRSKSPDTFCCVGPAIATAIDLASGRVVTTLDGTERQNYPLADMIFTPRELVSRISQDMTLLPGDVIACGTSIGVGSMKDGATVCIRIDGIGELRNRLGG
jgi:2-keto-4-pentenoate hydratase/2-oxohepta-3-ene-1,7-dioic acid hydratase in catechol pathway